MSIVAWFHALDLQLLDLINRKWSGPWLDPFMARISDFQSFTIPLTVGGILLLVFGGFRGRWFLGLMAACLLIGDATINWDFKRMVNRPRPNETEPHLRVVTLERVSESVISHPKWGRSFTSGHACNNVALAMVACAIYGRWAWLLWIWVLLVSYSRIYVGSHYPSDILGSWIVALFYSYFILKTADFWWRVRGPKACPGLVARYPVLLPGWRD